jgi:hypothetical protein
LALWAYVREGPSGSGRTVRVTTCVKKSREEVYNQSPVIQENIKNIYDIRTKANDFQIGDKVLKWDSMNEEKGKHGKFENLWKGSLIIDAYIGSNSFFIKAMDGADLLGGPVMKK